MPNATILYSFAMCTYTLTLITQYDGFKTTESFWEGVQKLKYLTVEDSCNKTYT